MKILLSSLAAAVVLTACTVNPQKAEVRRNAFIQRAFPNPADQRGLDLFIPLESAGIYPTLQISYFTQEVSEPEVRRRAASFCARQNSPRLTGQAVIERDIGYGTRTIPGRPARQIRTIFYSCVKSA